MASKEKLDELFINFAKSLATLSRCARVNVGSVIAMDGRVISTGYNGTPSGYRHCDEHFSHIEDKTSDMFKKLHSEFSIKEVHAEQNAILVAAKHGIALNGATVYTTISPCMDCAKAIIQCGIVRVVYAEEYDRDNYPLTFLKDNNVEVEQWKQR